VRFIAVIHGWHVSSNGFDVYELDARNEDDALKEGLVLMNERQSKFDTCALRIVPIENKEALAERKLTLKERLNGKLSARV